MLLHKLSEEENRVKYLTTQLEAMKEESRGNVEGEEKVLVEKVPSSFFNDNLHEEHNQQYDNTNKPTNNNKHQSVSTSKQQTT